MAENEQRPSRQEDYKAPTWVLGYFPQLLAATLIGMGIIAVDLPPGSAWLLWVPPGILLLAFAYAFWPRPKKKELVFEEAKAAVIVPKAAPKPAAAEAPKEAAPAAEAKPAAPKVQVPIDKNTVVVLWGSETGTAEGLANITADKLNAAGIAARAVSLGDVKHGDLAGFGKMLVITSTWGDGDPPSNAIDIWEAFTKGEKVDLSQSIFSVLSLGDTAYVQFCQCGKDFDKWFEESGAKRIHPRIDCDLDYQANFDKWYAGVASALQGAVAV